MWLREHVLEQAKLIEQVGGAGLKHLPAKLAIERLVPFQNKYLGAALGQKKTKHKARRTSTDDAGVYANTFHDYPPGLARRALRVTTDRRMLRRALSSPN